MGPLANIFFEAYKTFGGKASTEKSDADADAIFSILKTLDNDSFYAIQGSMELWFYHLMSKTTPNKTTTNTPTNAY